MSAITTTTTTTGGDVDGDGSDADSVVEIVVPDRGGGGPKTSRDGANNEKKAPPSRRTKTKTATTTRFAYDVVPFLVKDSGGPGTLVCGGEGGGAPDGRTDDGVDRDDDAVEEEEADDDDDVLEVTGEAVPPGVAVAVAGGIDVDDDERKPPAAAALPKKAGSSSVPPGTAADTAAKAKAEAGSFAAAFFDLCDDDDIVDHFHEFVQYLDDDDDDVYYEEPFGSDPSPGLNAAFMNLSAELSALASGGLGAAPPAAAAAAFETAPWEGAAAAPRAPSLRQKQAPPPGAAPSEGAARAKSAGGDAEDGVIDLEKEDAEADDDDVNSEAALARRYRKILGPLRFDFCETLPHHNATSGFRSTMMMMMPFGGLASQPPPPTSSSTTTTTTSTSAPTATGATSATAAASRSKTSLNKLARELVELKLNLPIELTSSIFVRAQEDDMSLVRALITGPEGTPYESGCFFFDFHLHDYPHVPPKARFLTTASGRVRFNPNLYSCGKVCLSLLGTWSGPGWEPKKSTLLQVLVSIQGLILVPDPFYNEPGFTPGTQVKRSEDYSARIRLYTVDHAISDALRNVLQDSTTKPDPYPEFQQIVFEHFRLRSASILRQLDAWQGRDGSIAPNIARARALLELVGRNDTLPAAQAEYATCAAAIPSPPRPAPRRAPFATASIPLPLSKFMSQVGHPPMASSSVTTPAQTPAPASLHNATPVALRSTRSLQRRQALESRMTATAMPPMSAVGTDRVGPMKSAASTAGPSSMPHQYQPSRKLPPDPRDFSARRLRVLRTKPDGTYETGMSHSPPDGTASGHGAAMDTISVASLGAKQTRASTRGATITAAPKMVHNGSRSDDVNSSADIPPAASSKTSESPTKGSLARATAAALGSCTKRARRGSKSSAPPPPASAAGDAKADPHDVIVID